MVKYRDEHLDAVFRALAHGTRRDMLSRLARGALSVTDLAAPLEMSLPAVSKHVRVLERAALVSRTKAGRYRYCRVNPVGFERAVDWLAAYRDLWTESFDRLDRLLADMTSEPGRRKPKGKGRRRE